MAARTIAKLDSPIFESTARRQAVSSFVSRQAKEFKNLTKRRMIESRASGKIVPRRKKVRFGPGFERRHIRSAKGQRPALETMTLVNAIDDKNTGDNSAEVFVARKPNPETGTTADVYAEILQLKLDRKIMTAEDASEAQQKMIRDGESMIGKLI